ncbi:MAG TPA: sigma-54 dependent transcriptional regulator [Candidatus Binatia bacterium]|nr:sigma-54 dependent transcriptional regulator [Candidatus Binatia bacterium]
MPHVLAIDSDHETQREIGTAAARRGFTYDAVSGLSEARSALAEHAADVVFVVDRLEDDGPIAAVLEMIDRRSTDVVVLASEATVASVVDALRAGASDYLRKPLDGGRLDRVLQIAARRAQIGATTTTPPPARPGRFAALVGDSRAMQDVHALIARVAPTSATVFLYGESGTGKELVAHTIHALSGRCRGPLVALNCAAMSPQLIESELFGHERGSFTGADRQHQGYFERADGGTLFLDEITEMTLDLQAKLLRSLETGTIMRIGGERDIAVDVRIIAATNSDPEAAARAGSFRRDLLYRLNVFPIRLPPLRDRGADIEQLSDFFLAGFNAEEGMAKRFTRAAHDRMRAYGWPGNVRELRNVVHHAFIIADEAIDADDLPIGGSRRQPETEIRTDEPSPSVVLRPGTSIAEAERRLILTTLEACHGDKREAARALGISLKTLYNRLKAYSGWANGRRRAVMAGKGGRWSDAGGS